MAARLLLQRVAHIRAFTADRRSSPAVRQAVPMSSSSPASIGITFYKAAGAHGEQTAVCPVTAEPFAPALRVEDLSIVLTEVGF